MATFCTKVFFDLNPLKNRTKHSLWIMLGTVVCLASAGGANDDALTPTVLPPCPADCHVHVYGPVTTIPSYLPPEAKDHSDWTDYYKSLGVGFLKGGFAYFYRPSKTLFIAAAPTDFDAIETVMSGPSSHLAKDQPPLRLDTLARQVDEIVTSPPGSMNILLWRIYHLLKSAGLGRFDANEPRAKWSVWQRALKKQKIELVQHWPQGQKGGYFKYRLKKNVSIGGCQLPQELYLLFMVDDKAATIVWAEPHLSCKLHLPYNDDKTRNVYAPDTVIGRLLHLEEVTKLATKYPLLESVDISYASVRNRWLATGPMGFSVELECSGSSQAGERLSGTFYYSVASGLDLITDLKGNPVTNEPFRPEDKLFYELGSGGDDAETTNGKLGIFLDHGGEEGVGPKRK